MQILRLYEDAAGESYFQEIDSPLTDKIFAPPAPAMGLSEPYKATQLVFVLIPGDFPPEWHPSPKRQMWLGLQGTIRVTASDGETRRISSGEVWLMEDTTGKGHSTVPADNQPALGAVIQLE